MTAPGVHNHKDQSEIGKEVPKSSDHKKAVPKDDLETKVDKLQKSNDELMAFIRNQAVINQQNMRTITQRLQQLNTKG